MRDTSHYLVMLLLVPGILATAGLAHAQRGETPPTYYDDALPVFRDHCASCHRPEAPSVGGITAPMSLLEYEAARQWAPLVKRAVQSGYMPPWGAHVRHKGEFKGERYLEEGEKALLVAWVDGGALEGEPPTRPAAEAEEAAPRAPRASKAERRDMRMGVLSFGFSVAAGAPNAPA